jgi:hypothetical protein
MSLVLLSGCYEGRGYAYEHLQHQDVGELHSGEQLEEGEEPGGVYEHLQNNLCEQNRYCCDDFTAQEVKLRELEQRAIIEENKKLCWELPEKALEYTCPNEEPVIYYSRQRCIDYFEELEE